MLTTGRLGLPFPEALDEVDVPAHIQSLTYKLDPNTAQLYSGLYAAIPPVASVPTDSRFWATDKGMEFQKIGGAWVLVATQPLLVTALPTAPIDGQEVYYSPTGSANDRWHLRWDANATAPSQWVVLGISGPMESVNVGVASYNQGTTLGDEILYVPTRGVYTIEGGAGLQIGPAFNAVFFTMQLLIDGADPGGLENASGYNPVANSPIGQSPYFQGAQRALNAGQQLRSAYGHNGSLVAANIYRRYLRLKPVRLG